MNAVGSTAVVIGGHLHKFAFPHGTAAAEGGVVSAGCVLFRILTLS